MEKLNHIVRMDTRLIYEGSFFLPARAMKVLAYAIAKFIDPKAEGLPERVVLTIRDFQLALYGKTHNRTNHLYTEIEKICKDLAESTISFRSGFEIEGVRLKGYLNWVSAALPKKSKEEGVYVELEFGRYMQSFLLGLSSYVRLHLQEIQALSKPHAIRLYQIFRGHANRNQHFGKKKGTLRMELGELKFLLGIEKKYPHFRDLVKYVIKPSVEQINERTRLVIEKWEYIRGGRGRAVSAIIFYYCEKEGKKERGDSPAPDEIYELSEAKFRAYQVLVSEGIHPGICMRMLESIKGSEIRGYEDKFCEFALKWIEQKADTYCAGVVVDWWLKKHSFDPQAERGDLWGRINEEVIAFKYKQKKKHPETYKNRMLAKDMTHLEFKEAMGS